MKKIIDMSAARKAAEKSKYNKLVLGAYDDLKHKETRQAREIAAEVNRKAKEAF